MKPNTNPETDIAYGVISAHSLHPDVVDTLMCYPQAQDMSYQEYLKECEAAARSEAEDLVETGKILEEDVEEYIQDRIEAHSEAYECDEPLITGTYKGVKYQTSWLGGALLFFITESPHTGEYAECSHCCPGAVDLDVEGFFVGYDVPKAWRK